MTIRADIRFYRDDDHDMFKTDMEYQIQFVETDIKQALVKSITYLERRLCDVMDTEDRVKRESGVTVPAMPSYFMGNPDEQP